MSCAGAPELRKENKWSQLYLSDLPLSVQGFATFDPNFGPPQIFYRLFCLKYQSLLIWLFETFSKKHDFYSSASWKKNWGVPTSEGLKIHTFIEFLDLVKPFWSISFNSIINLVCSWWSTIRGIIIKSPIMPNKMSKLSPSKKVVKGLGTL